ncbi:MAG: hypothetical protein AB9835_13800 [Eubacteriales bacterium]
MKTKRQEELVSSFLSLLCDEVKTLFQDLIICLSELGYNPSKDKTSIVFKHDQHNKQMAKVGLKKNRELSPFFALRFSACRDYSQKFADIIIENINKYPTRASRCINNDCKFCAGEAYTHVYTYTSSDGEIKTHCGAYVLEIPDITSDNIDEIKS